MRDQQDVLHYFNPVDLPEIHTDDRITQPLFQRASIHKTHARDFSFSDADVILLGIGASEAADRIRRNLYGLAHPGNGLKLADLGNLRPGKTGEDTHIGITDVLFTLGKSQKTLILIGDTTRQILPVFHGWQQLELPINLTVTDSRIDLMSEEHYLNSHYLNALVSDPESRLFDFVQLGSQSYFNDPESFERLDQFFFDQIRLGILREDIREAEPILRNSDLFFFSMSAIRMPEAPSTQFPSPNGLTAEESCQLARYAGLSDKLNLFGVMDLDGTSEDGDQTAALASQMIWYFMQGFSQRKKDYPFTDIGKYQKYIVNLPKAGHDLTFFKSPLSSRWWVEVPYPPSDHPRSIYVACSYRDYQQACDGEIPERWWKNYQRIS